MSYSTRNEAIADAIVAPIEISGIVGDARAEFDIDAIAEAVLGGYDEGYEVQVDTDQFWAVVESNER